MAVTRTNVSTNLDYVAYTSSDTIKDIFNSIALCLTNHGWTQISTSSAGTTFFNTYDPNAGTTPTNDFRRVFRASLTNTGSGLTYKYVMLRIVKQVPDGTAVYAYSSLSSVYYVQLIPIQSWNGTTDVGTNYAGTDLTATVNANGSYDNANWNNVDDAWWSVKAPHTWFSLSVGGFMYVAVSANWICMWPYFNATTIYNGPRCGVLIYGEVAEDFAAYTNVPPVYVTTLQRLLSGMGNVNRPSYYSNGVQAQTYGFTGLQFLMPVTPASTTGYTGVANTVRNGYQAMGTTRVMFGHYGWYGWDGTGIGGGAYTQASYYPYGGSGTYWMAGPNAFFQRVDLSTASGYTNMKYNLAANYDAVGMSGPQSYPYTITAAQAFQQTALNSTNYKGIEPIIGGGVLGAGSTPAGYDANPYPMWWALGRMYGLKFYGQPAGAASWNTLDTITMTTDAAYMYSSGGSSNTFILIGTTPAASDWISAAPVGSAEMFFALPA